MNNYLISFPLWIDEFGGGERADYPVTASSSEEAVRLFVEDLRYCGSPEDLRISLLP